MVYKNRRKRILAIFRNKRKMKKHGESVMEEREIKIEKKKL